MRTVSGLLLLVLLSACAGQTIEPSYYLLRTDKDLQSRPLQPDPEFTLGNVVIAPYIDQQGLVLETLQGEMRPASNHLWAEPLYESVRAFLVIEVSQARGRDVLPSRINKGATQIDVRIDQLHGTQDGQAKLVAYWWLYSKGEVGDSFQFAETLELAQEGYGALARAERILLSRLAYSIAASLEDAD